jgi:hypothetical protein
MRPLITRTIFPGKSRVYAAQAFLQHGCGHVVAADPDAAHTAAVLVGFETITVRAALCQLSQLGRCHLAERLAALWCVKARYADFDQVRATLKVEGVTVHYLRRYAILCGSCQ